MSEDTDKLDATRRPQAPQTEQAKPAPTTRQEGVTPPASTRSNVPTVNAQPSVPSGRVPAPPMRTQQTPLLTSPGIPPRRTRRKRAIFPPWWAIIAMLFVVAGLVGGLVLLFIALGGRTPPGGEPRLAVLTADPVNLAQFGGTILITATFPPEYAPQLQPPMTYVMQGPTLPPPAITPTAEAVAVGRTVTVIDVGDQQLNVRDKPGVLGTSIIFRSEEGSLFTVMEGPLLVDGLTWWRIQDPANATRTGWAASNYLQVAP